jgi:hypothetical protein
VAPACAHPSPPAETGIFPRGHHPALALPGQRLFPMAPARPGAAKTAPFSHGTRSTPTLPELVKTSSSSRGLEAARTILLLPFFTLPPGRYLTPPPRARQDGRTARETRLFPVARFAFQCEVRVSLPVAVG